MNLTLTNYIQGVRGGTLTPQDVIAGYKKKIVGDSTNSFLRIHDEYIDEHLEAFSSRPLAAAPIGIKDIILTKGYETSCGSDMLKGYIPPYSATCMSNLEAVGGLMIGKTNMDEFATGASGETSAFGPTKHPRDATRVPGGSSSGSAAAVAGDLCVASLGTDTGGSVRLPASLCGVVGVKPTYGRISRYGVQSMTSSFDQVGTFTKTVDDAAILLDALAGQDSRDAQTSPQSNFTKNRYTSQKSAYLTDKKFAVPKQYFDEGLDAGVRALCDETIEKIRTAGGVVDMVDVPVLSYAVPIYYIIVPAQLSTNLARFDGIRYGHSRSSGEFDSIYDYYAAVRNEGFGEEVKRRILTGTYVLSAGFYDAYYRKALAGRQKMIVELGKLYKDYDMILGPTGPCAARKLGQKVDDPISMYLMDIYTCPANITGLPALSLPGGTVKEDGKDLPVGIQLTANYRKEDDMLQTASALSDLLTHG